MDDNSHQRRCNAVKLISRLSMFGFFGGLVLLLPAFFFSLNLGFYGFIVVMAAEGLVLVSAIAFVCSIALREIMKLKRP